MTSVLSHSLKYASLYSKKAFALFTLTLLLFSSFLLLNQNAEAQQLVCPMLGIQQITFETAGDSRGASINADGTRIAFISEADINGGNPEGNFEIYLAVCFDVPRPIPTLSEWGLIAMAGVLGVIGLLAMRRRKGNSLIRD